MVIIPGEGAREILSIGEAREALILLGYTPQWAILNKYPQSEPWQRQKHPEIGVVFSVDFMQGECDNIGYYMPALGSVALTIFNGTARQYKLSYRPEDRIDFEDKPK